MSQTMKAITSIVLDGSASPTVEWKKSYYSSTTASWRLAGDAHADDPGTAVTITMTKGAANGVEADYYTYAGDIITTYTYTLYINSSPVAGQTGIMLIGMDLVQYIAGNYSHRIATTEVHGLEASSAVVGTTDEQTVTNKILTTPVIPSIYQDAGKTKLMTLPDTASDTLSAIAATQTMTNKTLTTPLIVSLYQDSIGGSYLVTMPAAADTLVGKATTDTFTNKTLTDNLMVSVYQDSIGGSKQFTLPTTAGGGALADDADLLTDTELVEALADGSANSNEVIKTIAELAVGNTRFAAQVAAQRNVSYGTAAYTTVKPTYIGQIYVDTDSGPLVYIAHGTSVGNWTLVSN